LEKLRGEPVGRPSEEKQGPACGSRKPISCRCSINCRCTEYSRLPRETAALWKRCPSRFFWPKRS